MSRVIGDVDRMRTAGDVDHRTAAEKRRHRPGLERRRHDDDAEIVTRAPGLSGEGDGEIRMYAALVKFVEDDGREIRQQRIVLQARGQDAFGHDEQPRVGAEAAFEADLPADLAAERPALLVRDPRGNRTRGHTPRLEQDDRAVRKESGRNASRLARAWRGGDHRGPRSPDDDRRSGRGTGRSGAGSEARTNRGERRDHMVRQAHHERSS